MVGYLSLEAGRWVAPLTQWDSAGSTYCSHDICDHPTLILRPSRKITNTHNANDTLLQVITTHLLAHTTLPALQKTKTQILRLRLLPFHLGFTISQLKSFASWETVTYRLMGTWFAARIWLILVVEPGLLWWELTVSTTLSHTIVASSNVSGQTPADPQKTLLHAIGTHPPSDSIPSPTHSSHSPIEHSTSPVTGRLQEVHNILITFVWMPCRLGAQTGSFVVGIRCAHHWVTETRLLQASHKIKNTHYANDTFLHAITTHSLAHNTLSALQGTQVHILHLPQLPLYQRFTRSSW